MVLDFPVLAEYCILWLDNRTIFATHGHKFNEQTLPPLCKGDILLNGHTHIPAYRETNGIIYINPGSVSIPKENSKHQYMILENNKFTWKELNGSILREETV